MKRAARLLLIAVGSLLLAACEIPSNLDELVGWRDSFFKHATSDQIIGWFWFFFLAMGFVLLVIGLNLAVQHFKEEEANGVATTLIVTYTLTILFLILFPDTVSLISNVVIGEELILDKIFENLHIKIGPNFTDIVTVAWAAGVAINTPQLYLKGLFIHLLLCFPILTLSILIKSMRGVGFVFAGFLGAVFFIKGWIAFVEFIGNSYPSFENPATQFGTLALFTGFTVIWWVLCQFVLPLTVLMLWPDFQKSGTGTNNPNSPSPHAQSESKNSVNWGGAATTVGTALGYMMGSGSQSSSSQNNDTIIYGNPPKYPLLNDPTIVEGKFTDAPNTNGDNLPPDPPSTNTESPANKATPPRNEDPVINDTGQDVIVINTKRPTEPTTPPKAGKLKKAAKVAGITGIVANIVGHPEVGKPAQVIASGLSAADNAKRRKKPREDPSI